MAIEWTEKQRLFLDKLSPAIDHYFLPGGARAGKTFEIIAIQVVAAFKYPGSRHLIGRLHFNHAKASIWMDTLPKVIKLLGLEAHVKYNRTDHVIVTSSGSEIWVDGFDDAERVEKILGREYLTIFFNEISQIPYDTVTTVRSRLAQKIKGACNRAFYDCNPVGRGHWGYKEFVLGVNPTTGQQLPDHIYNRMFWMSMTPYDNQDNLPENFIQNFLETLPDQKKKRFLLAEWADIEGAIYTNWSDVDSIPQYIKERAKRRIGVDFGFSVDPAVALDCYFYGEEIWIDELIYQTGLTNRNLALELRPLVDDITVICDRSKPEAIAELRENGINAKAAKSDYMSKSINIGIDYLQRFKIFITRRSTGTISDFQNYQWEKDDNDRILLKAIDDFNHAPDALRYAATPDFTDTSFNVERISVADAKPLSVNKPSVKPLFVKSR